MGRKKAKKHSEFSEDAVKEHFGRHLPGCPDDVRHELTRNIIGRLWDPPLSLGAVVGIQVTCYIRHRLTDYEYLLKKKVTREEARAVTHAEMLDILRSWQQPVMPQQELELPTSVNIEPDSSEEADTVPTSGDFLRHR